MLDSFRELAECRSVDKLERAQINLLFEHLGSEYHNRSQEQQKAMHGEHAARGTLQSGATVRSALRLAEDIATDFVKTVIPAVSDVSQDTEAFGMIAMHVTLLLRGLQVEIDQAVKLATGSGEGPNNFASVSREANDLFMELQHRVLRLLEIHRFSFTRLSRSALVELRNSLSNTVQNQPSKNKGGKPLAGHWDEMWAEIAVQLYVGDLQPKTQADIERAMTGWFVDRDLDVGDTAVRERARQLWRKYELAK